MGRARSGKGGTGRQLLLLLVLLGLLGGVGAWNYQRNAAEAEDLRPYRTLSEADIAALIAAYESEVEQLSARYERARQQDAPARGGGDWERFEAVQRHSRAVRELGRQLAEREGALEELREEQKHREEGELQRFLARLFTYSG